MPKRNRDSKNNRKRKIKGGTVVPVSVSDWWNNNITNGNLWQNTKKKFGETTNYVSSLMPGSQTTNGYSDSQYQQSQYQYQPPYTGGKKKSKKRGGNLASNASPVSGLATAKAHNWVGGKTRKYRKH